MYGLEPVAGVGKRAGHDHAHGIVEITAAHLFVYRDRANVSRVIFWQIRVDYVHMLWLNQVSDSRMAPFAINEVSLATFIRHHSRDGLTASLGPDGAGHKK